jgi:hypothetical protein
MGRAQSALLSRLAAGPDRRPGSIGDVMKPAEVSHEVGAAYHFGDDCRGTRSDTVHLCEADRVRRGLDVDYFTGRSLT